MQEPIQSQTYVSKLRVGTKTIENVHEDIEETVLARLLPHYKKANLAFPPKELCFIVLKAEKILEVWGENGQDWRFIRSYPVLGASGVAGPKLREGDRQVPEGIYRITWLHPNSSYHLSMKLNYPNEYDHQQANRERRTQLGGDIFIHGKDLSIGCVAIGDASIEDLFITVSKVGINNVKVIIVPNDLRKKEPIKGEYYHRLPWLKELYAELKTELTNYCR
ncbi:MAG TPA: L,D-transpeptidase family protein [Bacillota bacterium]|mgnify:CR=1 FL=1|jgi:murein L,D-transpeptidase YafK|nr:L,D-transpeptidase family protein [Bacillota bacterium]